MSDAPQSRSTGSADAATRLDGSKLLADLISLPCDQQFYIASALAGNTGYQLVPEPGHPDSPHGLAQAAPEPDLWAAIRQRDANINAAFAGLNAIEAQLHEMRSLKGWRLNLIRENLEKTKAALRTPTSAAYSVKGCGEWRDIETAPQDGNPVIVWDDPVLGEAYFDTGEKSWWWANTGPGDYTAEAIYPTLWRPMPAAPSLPSTNRAPRHVDDPGLAHPDNSDSPAWAVPSTEENSRG